VTCETRSSALHCRGFRSEIMAQLPFKELFCSHALALKQCRTSFLVWILLSDLVWGAEEPTELVSSSLTPWAWFCLSRCLTTENRGRELEEVEEAEVSGKRMLVKEHCWIPKSVEEQSILINKHHKVINWFVAGNDPYFTSFCWCLQSTWSQKCFIVLKLFISTCSICLSL